MAVPQHVYSLNFKLIQKEQQKDKAFLKGTNKSRSLICQEGTKHTELTIPQHFEWKKLPNDTKKLCQMCLTCHRMKQ
eukprot:8213097-Ditylum_brightwellii.AAC.1